MLSLDKQTLNHLPKEIIFLDSDIINAVDKRKFRSLSGFEPVMAERSQELWYNTGYFSIIFKLYDPTKDRYYAFKCFRKKHVEKEARLRLIADYMADYPSPYWLSYQFLTDELLVENNQGEAIRCNAILMDWVEGESLGTYIQRYCIENNRTSLYHLAYTFDQMGLWLLAQPFAHGDLNYDNIIIRPSGLPVLVDYDGVFIRNFFGEKSLENGTPEFQHPDRDERHYGSYLDDFSITIISLCLHSFAYRPGWLNTCAMRGNLLFFSHYYDDPVNQTVDSSNKCNTLVIQGSVLKNFLG